MSTTPRSLLGPALDQARLPFVACDAAGRLLALNAAAETLFGRSESDLIGAAFSDLTDPFSRTKAAAMITEVLARGAAYDWELNHPRVDGPPALVSYTAWLWHPSPGLPAAVAAVGQPLSAVLSLAGQLADTNQQLEGALLQLERAHAALKEAQAQLVRSEKMRALGQLVAGVAHEVNTPLGFVVNNLVLLGENLATLRALHELYLGLTADLPALAAQFHAAGAAVGVDQLWIDLEEIIPECRDGLDRITAIVQALRTFARPDSPGVQSADLNASLAGTVRIARSLAPKDVQLYEHYAPLPAVICNPGQISQVVLNLLTNAVQAVGSAGEVRIDSACADDYVVLSVSDTGVGMDALTLARLGEPFFTTRPLGAGTGLGLAISRGIAERHGGRLEFSSAPGQGTTVRLFLPIAGPPLPTGT